MTPTIPEGWRPPRQLSSRAVDSSSAGSPAAWTSAGAARSALALSPSIVIGRGSSRLHLASGSLANRPVPAQVRHPHVPPAELALDLPRLGHLAREYRRPPVSRPHEAPPPGGRLDRAAADPQRPRDHQPLTREARGAVNGAVGFAPCDTAQLPMVIDITGCGPHSTSVGLFQSQQPGEVRGEQKLLSWRSE